MIIKVMKCTPSVKNPLFYNINKVEQGEAELICVNNIKSKEFGDIYRTLMYRESMAMQTKNPSVHIVISADRGEGEMLTDKQVEKLIRDCFGDMALGDQPYVVFRHEDTDDVHFHVVSTKIMSNGRSLRWNGIGKRLTNELMKHEEEYGYLAGRHLHDIKQKSQKKTGINKVLTDCYHGVLRSQYCTSDEEFVMLAKNRYNIEIQRKPSRHKADRDIVVVRRLMNGERIGRPATLSGDAAQRMDDAKKRNRASDRTKYNWYHITVPVVYDELFKSTSATLNLCREVEKKGIELDGSLKDYYRELKRTWNQFTNYKKQLVEIEREKDYHKAMGCMLLCLNPLVGLLVLLLASLDYRIRKQENLELRRAMLLKVNTIREEIAVLQNKKAELILETDRLIEFTEARRSHFDYNIGINYFKKIDEQNRERQSSPSAVRTDNTKGSIDEYPDIIHITPQNANSIKLPKGYSINSTYDNFQVLETPTHNQVIGKEGLFLKKKANGGYQLLTANLYKQKYETATTGTYAFNGTNAQNNKPLL